MKGTGYIVDFNMSDGLAPGVIQKLNFNFKNVAGVGDAGGVWGGAANNVTYESLPDKPMIEGVELIDNKSFEDLTLNRITNSEIEEIMTF